MKTLSGNCLKIKGKRFQKRRILGRWLEDLPITDWSQSGEKSLSVLPNAAVARRRPHCPPLPDGTPIGQNHCCQATREQLVAWSRGLKTSPISLLSLCYILPQPASSPLHLKKRISYSSASGTNSKFYPVGCCCCVVHIVYIHIYEECVIPSNTYPTPFPHHNDFSFPPFILRISPKSLQGWDSFNIRAKLGASSVFSQTICECCHWSRCHER